MFVLYSKKNKLNGFKPVKNLPIFFKYLFNDRLNVVFRNTIIHILLNNHHQILIFRTSANKNVPAEI